LKYRKFGKTDFQASTLGFGAMRLPVIDNDQSKVKEAESIEMLRYAIDHGVNYIDSAYLYHMGGSEKTIARALEDGYREKVKVATKMPCNMLQKAEDLDRIFREQLDRLKTDRIEFYLLHGLNKTAWKKVQDLEILKWLDGRIAAGQIIHAGFSFHDTFDMLKEIIEAYSAWDFCQIQYNFMDINYQSGTRGLKYAAEKGLAVVVMEPLRGGRLSKEPPPEVAAIWAKASVKRSPAEWALLWVWEHPEVTVALSGMSALEQVKENVAIAGRCGPGVLTAEDMALADQVRRAYRKLSPVSCTGCRYCDPCPNKVDIARIFEIYNDGVIYNDPKVARWQYSARFGVKPENRADKCANCGECVEKCPQKIAIPERLKEAQTYLMPGT
jgi:uncharacterized protein